MSSRSKGSGRLSARDYVSTKGKTFSEMVKTIERSEVRSVKAMKSEAKLSPSEYKKKDSKYCNNEKTEMGERVGSIKRNG